MRVAYADPPYLGQSKKHYGRSEVNHVALINHLEEFDAWALSCSSPSLPTILPMCPEGIRIGAWVKPFCSFKPNVNPAYAWEPVIFKGARKRERSEPTVRDFVSENITLQKNLSGVKPRAFCLWLFELMGLTLDDEFFDLFPGSGAVQRAWDEFCHKPRQLEMGA